MGLKIRRSKSLPVRSIARRYSGLIVGVRAGLGRGCNVATIPRRHGQPSRGRLLARIDRYPSHPEMPAIVNNLHIAVVITSEPCPLKPPRHSKKEVSYFLQSFRNRLAGRRGPCAGRSHSQKNAEQWRQHSDDGAPDSVWHIHGETSSCGCLAEARDYPAT